MLRFTYFFRIYLLSLIVIGSILFYFLRFTSKVTPSEQENRFLCPAEPRKGGEVPNIVHYTQFDKKELSFVSFICILSAYFNQKPKRIQIHTNLHPNKDLNSTRWQRLKQILGPILRIEKVARPTHVFGKALSSVQHSNDIFKINLAYNEGGIFLDQDTFIVQNLDKFRQYEVTIGWPQDQFIGIQIFLAAKNAQFLQLWLASYRDYRADSWYYNGGELPTKLILKKCPTLVFRVTELFGVQKLSDLLYSLSDDVTWKKFYSIHLLERHRSYLNKQDILDSKIIEFDEINIQTYNKTFGFMARNILEKLKDPLSKINVKT